MLRFWAPASIREGRGGTHGRAWEVGARRVRGILDEGVITSALDSEQAVLTVVERPAEDHADHAPQSLHEFRLPRFGRPEYAFRAMSPKKPRPTKPVGANRKRPAPPADQATLRDAPPARTARRPDNDFFIVGIGASAGGLEALKQFFAAVPENPGMAFVVVTHRQSGNVTLLPELLGKQTSLSIVGVQSGLKVAPNVVYIAPAEEVVLHNGHFQTTPAASTRSAHHPIDTFFRSLASTQEELAVAIVLSGTGTDGTSGIGDVKMAGGLVLAQDPETAKFASMPASAVASRFVDAVLAPAAMPKMFERFAKGNRPQPPEPPPEEAGAALLRVLHLLRGRTGQDFTAYKKSTLWRRVERRMTVRGVPNASAYAHLLEEVPEEIEILFRELLISVTSFFRDPDTFVALSDHLRRNFEQWDGERPFRAWIPACATGEEAYSIAMTIREVLSALDKRIPVQIFATDLDQPAIDFARSGHYPIGIDAHVAPERLQRFFVKTDTGYRVSKEIRESIVFAPQNVIKDPPFTKLDLLSCRNLLIYLEPDLQRRVIGLFSYALRPGGLLLLGSSESIATFDDAFYAVDKNHKLFRRRDTRPETPAEFPEAPSTGQPGRPRRPEGAGRAAQDLTATAERLLLTHLAPPSVLISDRGDIAYFHGRTGNFLEPAAGEPVSNLFGMLRDGLRVDVSAALREASTRSEPIVRSGIKVKSNGGDLRVKLTVRRLDGPESVRGMFLVSFELESEPPEAEHSPGDGEASALSPRIGDLELELEHTRDNLQATIEELETSNEELKSTNEELQSTNEELQSANEELETSREEMQSLNEELQTVNSELEERNRALSQANDDMQNLLNSTDVATVFLDNNLAIKRFTTQARKVFSLIDTDIGRPISDLSANLRYEDLLTDAREVLRSLVFQEREILTKEGAWRLMRIMPYRTAENVIDGLVMTFIDIDRIKRDQETSDTSRIFAQSLIETVPSGVAVVDAELRVVTANRAFLTLLKTNPKRAIGEPVQAVADGVLDVPELIDSLPAVRDGSLELSNLRLPPAGNRLGGMLLSVSAYRMVVQRNQPIMILLMVDSAG